MAWSLLSLAMVASAVAQDHAHHRQEPLEPVPALTDADRAAAVPDTRTPHSVHDEAMHGFVLADQVETWDGDEAAGLGWHVRGWIGGDVHRGWVRTSGARADQETEAADVELLRGWGLSRWWDLVASIRHDFRPGSSQTFVGVGLIGIAPYEIEVDATAYVGESGQATLRVELEYELLLTNRWILQPLLEVDVFARDDESRGVGSGLSTVDVGLRLRYEVSRRFAPYVGLVYENAFSSTADLREAAGEPRTETLLVAGIRTWF